MIDRRCRRSDRNASKLSKVALITMPHRSSPESPATIDGKQSVKEASRMLPACFSMHLKAKAFQEFNIMFMTSQYNYVFDMHSISGTKVILDAELPCDYGITSIELYLVELLVARFISCSCIPIERVCLVAT